MSKIYPLLCRFAYTYTNMDDAIINFFKDHGLNLIIILIIGNVMRLFALFFIKQLISRSMDNHRFKTEGDRKQRKQTLIAMISAGVRVVVWIIIILMLLAEIDIDIAPLLAGAGILGVALGFGAQSLVANFLAGIFVLSENHYRVGDVIKVNNDTSGKVERVTLRETVLRDLDGMVHHIPNGEIKISTNMTMEFANVNLDVTVVYDTDIEKLEKVINEVGTKLANDPEWDKVIIEAPYYLRLNEFRDSGMEVKVVGKTAAMKHWAVTGELRKRLKIAFDKNGIQFAYPTITLSETSKPRSKK